MVEFYKMRVVCENCGTYSQLEIEKGIEKDEVIGEAECPNCGVEGQLNFD